MKLLDFGIAKSAGRARAHVALDVDHEDRRGRRHAVLHEPRAGHRREEHRLPHAISGRSASSRSRRSPAKRRSSTETVGALALKIHRDPLPVPSSIEKGLPQSVDAWFARACARAVEERFTSAKEMAEALSIAITGERATPSLAISDSKPASSQNEAINALALTALQEKEASFSRQSRDDKIGTHSGLDLSGGSGAAIAKKSGPPWRMALAAIGIGFVAAGIGFGVPKLMKGESPAAGSATLPSPVSSPSAAAVTSVVKTAEPVVTASAPVEPPASAKPNEKKIAGVGTTTTRPVVSALPVVTASAPATGATRPPKWNDDDIK